MFSKGEKDEILSRGKDKGNYEKEEKYERRE